MSKKLIALLHRHGQTSLNSENAYRSRMDPPLNDVGLQQAYDSAEFLARYDIERIVSSPMLRAYQTALITQQEFSCTIPLVQDRALMPWDIGFLAGLDRDLYADILQMYVDHPDKVVPDGEALDQLKQRTEQFFTQEFERDEGLTVFTLHTSNITTLGNLLNGESTMQAEVNEAVAPGGVLAVYQGARGLETEPIYGQAKPQTYGVS